MASAMAVLKSDAAGCLAMAAMRLEVLRMGSGDGVGCVVEDGAGLEGEFLLVGGVPGGGLGRVEFGDERADDDVVVADGGHADGLGVAEIEGLVEEGFELLVFALEFLAFGEGHGGLALEDGLCEHFVGADDDGSGVDIDGVGKSGEGGFL